MEACESREDESVQSNAHNLPLHDASGEEVTADFDVVGVGLNATDTLLLLPKFPAYAGKVPFTEEILSPGGQVASAMVTCSTLGMRTKYIGTVGDDLRGQVQMESLLNSGINLDH